MIIVSTYRIYQLYISYDGCLRDWLLCYDSCVRAGVPWSLEINASIRTGQGRFVQTPLISLSSLTFSESLYIIPSTMITKLNLNFPKTLI